MLVPETKEINQALCFFLVIRVFKGNHLFSTLGGEVLVCP